tara:strand:- start:39883 stop:41847 length:1965 start_codon:yes stop_codon:yes gene_type:complete
MSKGPESDGSRRKRRGGLRVPSDEVPRRASAEVAAPVPEAVGLAASVSESFGVMDPGTEAGGETEIPEPTGNDMATEEDLDELPTVVSDRTAADMAEAAVRASDAAMSAPVDLRATLPMSARPVHKETPPKEEMTIQQEDVAQDEEVIEDIEGSALVTGEIKEIVDEDAPVNVAFKSQDEAGESVDIPFDDGDETTVTASIPVPAPVAEAAIAAPKPAAPATDREETVVEDAGIGAIPSLGDLAAGQDKPKKPRFNRALTMALSDSDLEEVRLEDGSRIPARRSRPVAAPAAQASRAESGELLDDSELEEVATQPQEHSEANAAPASAVETPAPEASDAPPLPVATKRAETAEPPPPPAKAKGPSKAPPAPKPAAPKAKPKSPRPKVEASGDSDDGKRRGRKPWFEDIFDEDYLRTLPFLTPQATKFEANFVMESLGVEPGAQLLDVGCGYGRHAMELAARGYHLVGLDSSLPLLLRGADEAQRRGLTINFVHGDMREMTFESQFDGAYCLFSSFGYFDDETNKRTAQNIAKALKPGARFVVEVLNRDYLVADLPSRVWWEGDGCVVLEEVEFNYFSSRIVSNRSVVFDDGRQLEHEISLRSFSLHELGKFLHAVGFRVLEISGSMSTRGRFFGAHSRDIVVVAEKRATKADET